jgi:hypothetical protein
MAAPVIVVPATLAFAELRDHDPRHPRPGPRRLHHEVFRGDTIQLPFQVVNRATRGPLDVTNWTMWFTAKYAVPNPDAQAALAQDNIVDGGLGGIVFTDPTTGQGVVTCQPIATRGYPDGPVHLEYDMQVQDAEGVITTVELGGMTVLPDVTESIGS